jgi:hypothetical protein
MTIGATTKPGLGLDLTKAKNIQQEILETSSNSLRKTMEKGLPTFG